MRDRYRLVPPGGGEPRVIELEPGTSVSDACELIAAELQIFGEFSLLLRNPPGAALPFVSLAHSESPLRSEAPPGSVLIVEVLGGAAGVAEFAAEPSTFDTAAPLAEPSASASAPGAAPSAAPVAEPLVSPRRRGLTGLRNLGTRYAVLTRILMLYAPAHAACPCRMPMQSLALGTSCHMCYYAS